MKNLVIVESPSKSKTIEKYLGKDYEVVSSKGHIRDLAIKGKDGLGVDINDNFKATYTVSDDKKETVKELKAKAKKADQVYLATDPDREGEAISWHLASELKLDVDQDNRVVFNEITKDAVLQAFDHPRKIDMDLVHSQETRRILDRIIGFKLSKLLKSKIRSKSAGRVQSVALKLIVEREKEIKAFVPVEYWTLDAKFKEDGKEFSAALAKINGKKAEIHNQEEADQALAACQGEMTVSALKKQVRKKEAKPPLITSTLQQEASTKLGFSAKKTMQVAQRLYEGVELEDHSEGLITYMRTDSTRLSNVFIEAAQGYITERFGKEYWGKYKIKNDENSQDAHEAIRPTSLDNEPEQVKKYLSPDQYKLYKLIYARAVASLMAPSKSNTVSVVLSINGYDFNASGTQLAFEGYLKMVSDYESSKDVLLPDLSEGQKCTPVSLNGNQHFTEPPLRYSEARLIKEMEEQGIGRPSTYSMIIDTIQQRGYVELKKASETSKTKVFFPTEQGELTSQKLEEFFNDIINVRYTANMETELDEIAEGDRDHVQSLKEFYDKFEPLVDNAYQNMEKMEPEKIGEACPECGGELVIRQGRFGKFISCLNYPQCKYTRKIEAPEKEKPEPTGKLCPECGGELLKRKSRYGNYFLGCSNFPKCRHIENIEGEKKPTFRRKGKKKDAE
ncbi:type I DNA topoisomerase [Holdemania massiliensis]|uniref:type I DNA topoisomerase n=1 Tax=Holdemania massiliensis TaxID=1468449 RepID=UPI001F064196|nr:type I DNA topoisomerase [Holdemania massiliensis]MCH1940439.1 type I DNA topoisomerase [Holdemania massiliensis]